MFLFYDVGLVHTFDITHVFTVNKNNYDLNTYFIIQIRHTTIAIIIIFTWLDSFYSNLHDV